MNLELFNMLMKLPPSQEPGEWKTFLEICESYLKEHEIKNPVVVELGIYKNLQKRFYEQLLGADHIGIDTKTIRAIPDIIGNTRDDETLKMLKKRLNGRLINILFIDANHWYENVKKDFEMYSPLCDDIIALHDIDINRHRKKGANRCVWKFWDELRKAAILGTGEYADCLFVAIGKKMGIGMIIKK